MTEQERTPFSLPAQETAPIQPERSAEGESAAPQYPAPQERASPLQDIQAVRSRIPQQHAGAQDSRAGVLKQVEALLSDGLMQLYLSLPESRRMDFKQHGERVANTITDMIMYGKAKVKEVWKLIGEWLRMVPGVNKYFLEQEIKIKTDRIMMFAESSVKA